MIQKLGVSLKVSDEAIYSSRYNVNFFFEQEVNRVLGDKIHERQGKYIDIKCLEGKTIVSGWVGDDIIRNLQTVQSTAQIEVKAKPHLKRKRRNVSTLQLKAAF